MPKLYEYQAALDQDSAAGAVLRHIPKSARILEIGCSVGSQTRIMTAELGCTVTAIEIDPSAAEKAAPHCHQVIVGNIEEMDLAPLAEAGPFDAITFADVLEHLRDPGAALRKVAPLLTTGGVLVASVPNVTHAALAYEIANGRFSYREFGLLDNTHIRFFDRHGIVSLFEEAGYFVLQLERVIRKPEETEFSVTPVDEADKALLRYIRANNPDHDTYQFILQAVPRSTEGQALSALHLAGQKVHDLERALASAQNALKQRDAELAWERSSIFNRLRYRLAGLWNPPITSNQAPNPGHLNPG
ncbi:MAG: class I SAM-dependent methyltransferase [Rhodocyclaceae bacterium]|jgi:2-polyprenyl-3-methyl-5-hydroxy-6-metoxy-1,4-benzoquinol methylase|nr:class I SAM-dependent methyltransferase [Rhodocyclaceae bacterium]